MLESNFFVIRMYVGVHSYSLLSRNASHRQATYVVVGKQVTSQFLSAQKGPVLKSMQSLPAPILKQKSVIIKLGGEASMPKVSSGVH